MDVETTAVLLRENLIIHDAATRMAQLLDNQSEIIKKRLEKADEKGNHVSAELLTIKHSITTATKALLDNFRQDKWDEVQRMAAAVLMRSSDDSETDSEEEMDLSYEENIQEEFMLSVDGDDSDIDQEELIQPIVEDDDVILQRHFIPSFLCFRTAE